MVRTRVSKKVHVPIWLDAVFIVHFKCSIYNTCQKQEASGVETKLPQDAEALVPDLRGGCISFFPSWPLRSLRRGFFYARPDSISAVIIPLPYFPRLFFADRLSRIKLSNSSKNNFDIPYLAIIIVIVLYVVAA